MNRLINVGLRGTTLVSKFLLVFFLARFIASEEVGMYGLLAASIGYGIYLIGFEFYNYANRELITAEPEERLSLIRDQLVLYGFLYAVCLPLCYWVFWQQWLDWQYFYLFLALLLLEHIAQEVNRILVAVSRQLLASVVLFVRSGVWCLLVMVYMWLDPSSRTLQFTLVCWLVGCFVACVIGCVSIVRLGDRRALRPVNWLWIRQGFRVAIPFLLASLAIRGIFTFDRYWVEHLAGLQVLGAYTLYVGMATAVLSFLDAGVIVFFIPRLIKAVKQDEPAAFRSLMRVLALNVLVVVVALVVMCSIGGAIVFDWLASPVYRDHVDYLYWLLLATALYGLSMVPHLGLYAHGVDRPILHSQVAAFAVFALVSYWLSPHWGVDAVLYAMVIAFLVVFIWKMMAYLRLMGWGR